MTSIRVVDARAAGARRRRVWAGLAGAAGLLSCVFAFQTLLLQHSANEATRPVIAVVGGSGSAGGVFSVQYIAVTNTGGSDVAITRAEVLTFPYAFVSPSSISGDEWDLGVIDLVSAFSDRHEFRTDMRTSDGAESCTAGEAVVPANGLPVMFVALAPSVALPDGRPTVEMSVLATPERMTFVVRLHYLDGSSEDYDVVPDEADARLSAISDDLVALVNECATGWDAQARIPSGTVLERFDEVTHAALGEGVVS